MSGANTAIVNILYNPISGFGDRIFDRLLENLFNSKTVSLDKDFKISILKIPYQKSDRERPHFDLKLWKDFDFNFVIIVLDSLFEDSDENVDFLIELKKIKSTSFNTHIVCVTDTIDLNNSRSVGLFNNSNFLRPLAFIKDNDVDIPITDENIDAIFCIEFFHFAIKVIKGFLQGEKVKLFLSHAKLDGKKIAKKLKKIIDDVTQLARFFDLQDIGISEDFNDNIKSVIESDNIVFLIILTDMYSTRTVCKMEVLHAKLHQKPIVLINAIEKFEKRSFPYLNNTPVFRWSDEVAECLKIIKSALYEFLKIVLIEKEISNFLKENSVKVNKVLFTVPELLTFAQNKIDFDNEFVIIHPSPDMDLQEKALFNSIAPKVKFITPW